MIFKLLMMKLTPLKSIQVPFNLSPVPQLYNSYKCNNNILTIKTYVRVHTTRNVCEHFIVFLLFIFIRLLVVNCKLLIFIENEKTTFKP